MTEGPEIEEHLCKDIGVYGICVSRREVAVCNGRDAQPTHKKLCPLPIPYCVTYGNQGSCSSKLAPGTHNDTVNSCTSAGFFPDPRDCTAFYICTSDREHGIPRNCPDGEIFSEVTSRCKKPSSSAECMTVNCATSMGNGVFSPYGISKKYFAYCDTPAHPNDLENISMYQCANGAEFDRTPSVSKCIFRCKSIGKFENSLDQSTYYNCYSSGKDATGKLEECPNGWHFHFATQGCNMPA